jgi:hypothetical protein
MSDSSARSASWAMSCPTSRPPWTTGAPTLGVGPWFYNPKVPIKNYTYNGERYEPHNSVALANSGFVQVELIQTRNDVPSMYRDFLQAGRTGLQHVAYWTDTTTPTWRACRAGLQARDERRGRRARPLHLLRHRVPPGTVIELSEVAGPKGKMFDLIRERLRRLGRQRPGAALPRPEQAVTATDGAMNPNASASRPPT